MELIKSIIALITSFFQSKTASTKKEETLADVTKTATTETIRADANEDAINQKQHIENAVENLASVQKQKQQKESKKSIDDQFDDQFGQDK